MRFEVQRKSGYRTYARVVLRNLACVLSRSLAIRSLPNSLSVTGRNGIKSRRRKKPAIQPPASVQAELPVIPAKIDRPPADLRQDGLEPAGLTHPP